MLFAKLKLTAAVTAVACVLAAGTLVATRPTGAAPAPRPAPQAPGKDSAKVRDWLIVPAPHQGILAVIGREIKPGEKVPPGKVVRVRVGGKLREYRRLAEGDRVEKGDLLGRLDDVVARQELAIKQAKVDSSEAEHRAALKTRDEAKVRYEATVAANARAPGTVSQDEARGALLTWQRYNEEVEQKRQNINVALAEREQARTILERHEIRSPASGVIEAILKKEGEAVKWLEPVFRIRIANRK
jgi:multidrug efflux pump subunit AcrA (membrane-fusion protein)